MIVTVTDQLAQSGEQKKTCNPVDTEFYDVEVTVKYKLPPDPPKKVWFVDGF